MSTSAKAPEASASSSARSGNNAPDYRALQPHVTPEDELDPERVQEIWRKFYDFVGANGEAAQLETRVGVYYYCLVNGTSREGAYSTPIRLASGKTIPSALIPRAVSKMMIRKFLRGNMNESYNVLKAGDLSVEPYTRVVSMAAKLSIGPGEAFAMADWLADCPLFTPEEAKAHERSYNDGIERARRARGGKSLETVESQRARQGMDAQGPMSTVDEGSSVTF